MKTNNNNNSSSILKSLRQGVTVMLITATLLLLAGCAASGSDATEPVGAASSQTDLPPEAVAACEKVFARSLPDSEVSLVVVWDLTASAADAPLPAGLIGDLQRVSQADGSLTLIAVDGADVAPTIVAKQVALSTPGERDRPSVAELAAVIPACVSAVYGPQLLPREAGTDLHRALALAAELVQPGTTVWLVSDMMSNTGPLTLDAALVARDPADAAAIASAAAPVDLAGATLKVSGVANTSAALLAEHRSWMRDFTQGLCEGWNATGCDEIELDPVNPVRATEGLPLDPIPAFPSVGTTATADGCLYEVPAALAFSGDSAALGAAAAEALAGPLEALKRNPRATATVTGHAASHPAYSQEELLELSTLRAISVREFFTTNGIDIGRVTALGVGDREPKVEDIDPVTGARIPEMVEIERRVDVVIEGVPCSR